MLLVILMMVLKCILMLLGFDTSEVVGIILKYLEEGISNTIEFLSHKPNYSSTYYQNDGILLKDIG